MLTGLLGRFGNVDDDVKDMAKEYISYLFDRGDTRVKFWKQWVEDHREVYYSYYSYSHTTHITHITPLNILTLYTLYILYTLY